LNGPPVKLKWTTTTVVVDPNLEEAGMAKADHGAATTTTHTLGSRLRQARELRQQSLSSVAKESGISTAYLQKLEVNDVRAPSPNHLHRLSQVLEIDYAELMRLAGYVVPNDSAHAKRRRNELTHAFSSDELTEEEADELAEYLLWYRTRNQNNSRQ
jgi:HTH-type transcriptional regulator, competence development regulator